MFHSQTSSEWDCFPSLSSRALPHTHKPCGLNRTLGPVCGTRRRPEPPPNPASPGPHNSPSTCPRPPVNSLTVHLPGKQRRGWSRPGLLAFTLLLERILLIVPTVVVGVEIPRSVCISFSVTLADFVHSEDNPRAALDLLMNFQIKKR